MKVALAFEGLSMKICDIKHNKNNFLCQLKSSFVKSLNSSYRKELQGTNCNLYLVDRTQTVQLRSNLRNVLPLLYFTLLVGRVILVSSGVYPTIT